MVSSYDNGAAGTGWVMGLAVVRSDDDGVSLVREHLLDDSPYGDRFFVQTEPIPKHAVSCFQKRDTCEWTTPSWKVFRWEKEVRGGENQTEAVCSQRPGSLPTIKQHANLGFRMSCIAVDYIQVNVTNLPSMIQFCEAVLVL
jgi:hypothetical protein